MKFRIGMKDCSALDYAKADVRENHDYDVDEAESLVEYYTKKWFTYGEYVTLEIDTDTNTICVLEAE